MKNNVSPLPEGALAIDLPSGFAWLNSAEDSAALRQAAAAPEALLQQARLLKNSRSTCAGLGTLENGAKVFIKRHNNKGLRYTLRYLFRPARPLKAFRAALALRDCGVTTPTPLAAIVHKKAGILASAYQISAAVEGALPAEELRKRLGASKEEREFFASKMGALLSGIHSKGIAHGDLKMSNIFAIPKGASLSFGLWDFDAASVQGHALPARLRVAELARLCSSYIELGARLGLPEEGENETLDLFVAPYERAAGCMLARGSILAAMRRHLKRK